MVSGTRMAEEEEAGVPASSFCDKVISRSDWILQQNVTRWDIYSVPWRCFATSTGVCVAIISFQRFPKISNNGMIG